MTAPRVLCAGMAVLDEIFRVEHVPPVNTKVIAAAFASAIGGCAANAAVAIVRLAGDAELAAVLGDPLYDEIGDRILAGLARERVACPGIVRVGGATSTISTILVDASGERTIVTHCDERLFVATAQHPGRLVAAADVVLADNWLPDLVVPLCAAAQERGLPVVIDGDGPMAATSPLMTLATHVVFSSQGLRATSGDDDLDAALARLAANTRAFLAVTDGAGDIRWWDGRAAQRMPVFPVQAVDTLAAGDVFHGAFALALAEARDAVAALRFAAAAAALKCTRFGGGGGAPSRREVDALLARSMG